MIIAEIPFLDKQEKVFDLNLFIFHEMEIFGYVKNLIRQAPNKKGRQHFQTSEEIRRHFYSSWSNNYPVLLLHVMSSAGCKLLDMFDANQANGAATISKITNE